MAIDTIKINVNDTNATQARLILTYRDTVRAAYDLGKRIRDNMLRMHDGTNFTEIETYYGGPVGSGEELFTLVNGSVGSFEGLFQNDNAKQLTERLI